MIMRSPFEDTLPQLVARLWGDRRIVFMGVVTGIVLAVILSVLLKPQYEASMIISPSNLVNESQSFIDNDTVGVGQKSISANNDLNFTRFQQSLRGVSVAGIVIQMNDVAQKLSEDTLFRGFHRAFEKPEDVAQYFEQQIGVEPVGASTSLRVTYRHSDRVFAARLLSILRKADDQLIKNQDKEAATKRIEWLKESLKNAINPEHRQALAKLLMVEERRVMLLSQDTPYTIQLIEEASAHTRPSVPHPLHYILLLGILGGIAGAGVVIIRDAWASGTPL